MEMDTTGREDSMTEYRVTFEDWGGSTIEERVLTAASHDEAIAQADQIRIEITRSHRFPCTKFRFWPIP